MILFVIDVTYCALNGCVFILAGHHASVRTVAFQLVDIEWTRVRKSGRLGCVTAVAVDEVFFCICQKLKLGG